MISEANIKEILGLSILLKDDHVRVFNYENKYIIKEGAFSQEMMFKLPKEEVFLNFMIQNGVRINRLLHYFSLEDKIYSIYAFEAKTSETYDYFKIGSNIRKMHDLSKNKSFGFEKYRLNAIDFSEIKSLYGESMYEQWISMVEEIRRKYEETVEGKEFNVTIHHDIILQNIIEPYTLIDTETLRTGLIQHDIGSIIRLGYRNHQYDIMNSILKGYGLDNVDDTLFLFMHLKDVTTTKWLLNNHKNDTFRLDEIHNRIKNFYNFEYKWTVF